MVDRKKELRKTIASAKRKHSIEGLELLSESVIGNLMQLDIYKEAKVILLYYSMPDEVNTKVLITNSEHTKRVILPVVTKEGLILKGYDSSIDLIMSNYGIMEPSGNVYDDFDEIDLVIVPGVAFDASLNRMGRGMGYYDGLLPKINAPKVGICFDFQLVDDVPVDSRDIKMDMIVCESKLIS